MKFAVLMFSVIFSQALYSQVIHWKELDPEKSNNCIYYQRGDSLPYSGIVVDKKIPFKIMIFVLKNGVVQSDSLFKYNILKSCCNYYNDEYAGDSIKPDKKCYFFRSRKLEFIGELKNGIPLGEYIYYYKNGNIRFTGFLNEQSKETGHWMFYTKKGTLSFEGFYKNGKKNGDWIWYDEDGAITDIENYSDDIKN